MLLSAGRHQIGPRTGRLTVRTFREGRADDRPRLVVEVDLRSVEVREGHGGAMPLTGNDRREIQQTIAEILKTADHPQALFASTTVRVEGDTATVDGDLTLVGVTHPLRFTARAADDGTVIGHASVQQSRWGVRPYRGFMGALKVRDVVEVEATVTLA